MTKQPNVFHCCMINRSYFQPYYVLKYNLQSLERYVGMVDKDIYISVMAWDAVIIIFLSVISNVISGSTTKEILAE